MAACLIVYTGIGFLKERHGIFRILIIATSPQAAADHLSIPVEEFKSRFSVSRISVERNAFSANAVCGDALVSPRGRKEFEGVDLDEIEP